MRKFHRRFHFIALYAFVALAMLQGDAFAGVRLALVLGNSKYQAVPALDNPANDAADLAQVLRDVGFEVIEQRDASRESMAKAVHDFSERLRGADVALFFYAGHGLQMNGENYLLPVDAKIENPSDVRFNTINLTDIQQEMEEGGNGRANIIILDACRNNPFAEKLSRGGRAAPARGLGRIDATGQGSLIVYSTQPNNVALDGGGRNSPFTSALLKHVATPGLEVRQMISRVRGDVLLATGQRQTPWDSSSLVGDVYLAGPLSTSAPIVVGSSASQAASPPPAAPTPAAADQLPLVAAQAAESGSSQRTAPPAPPVAAPEAVKECDRLTAPREHTADPQSAPAAMKIDWNRAVTICEAAVKAEPSEPHFHFALGKSYFYARNYLEAARNLTIAANAGLPDAQNALGYCYDHGLGVVKSDQKAFELYSKAAAGGSALGMGSLGTTYIGGGYVKQDFSKALDWYEKSIEAGNSNALAQTGNMYFNGQGVPRDYAMAAQYFQQAADLGDGDAMKFLANMVQVGFLGPPDLEKADALRLRAQQVDPDSRDPDPIALFRRIYAESQSHGQARPVVHQRRYVIYRRFRPIGCSWLWC